MVTGQQSLGAEKTGSNPDFFARLSAQQAEVFLWIGCSDSRVPADMITGTQPGEIFVHRNIADLVVNTDINLLIVLQYAVEVLKVNHVIVCGHYGYEGIRAAMDQHHYGIISHWLKYIKDIYPFHRDEVDALPDDTKRADRLTELNVEEQIFNLAKTSLIQKGSKYEQRPHLHGWMYGINNEIIKPFCEMEPGTSVDPIFEYDNL